MLGSTVAAIASTEPAGAGGSGSPAESPPASEVPDVEPPAASGPGDRAAHQPGDQRDEGHEDQPGPPDGARALAATGPEALGEPGPVTVALAGRRAGRTCRPTRRRGRPGSPPGGVAVIRRSRAGCRRRPHPWSDVSSGPYWRRGLGGRRVRRHMPAEGRPGPGARRGPSDARPATPGASGGRTGTEAGRARGAAGPVPGPGRARPSGSPSPCRRALRRALAGRPGEARVALAHPPRVPHARARVPGGNPRRRTRDPRPEQSCPAHRVRGSRPGRHRDIREDRR